ncbi:hypothetical protein ONZ51_g4539 [Trametes cubensis]|uniref:Major facilitator superfamily (MFS) profile domain-containing protein n=1 Tax=Trametes cubensis TaxID=1111947 RepID=A0AAD7TY37_9APHY|nr:hypothetical protein ONZ51_g4539 [Trametes cubensis]
MSRTSYSPHVSDDAASNTSRRSKTREDVVVNSSDFDAEVVASAPRLSGPALTAAIAFVAGTGFTLFGYDQGVMSALLTAKQFENVFPQVAIPKDGSGNHATLQSFVVAIYTASYSYAQLVVARIITGLGNGLNTSTVPSYHAECSPAARRGSLIMIEGSLITFGIMISYWIDFAFFWISGSTAQWRVPIALQIVLALIMIVGISFLPESPRWLAKHGRDAEALAVISALDDKPHTDAGVQQTYHGIREAIAAESHHGNDSSPLREVFTNGRSQNFRRAFLGVVVQCFQQITGINLITYYATLLFERLGIDDVKARIIAAANGTEYFLASLIAIALIDRIGRRPLMLFGAIGQTITMVLLAPAEIVGLRIRAPANAFSTASNWTFNFMVVMVTGPAFNNISWRTYIVFASLNAFIIPIVYLFFPETAGRSLEDMDVVFALAYNEGVSPVKVSLRKDIPPAGSPEADEILGISGRDGSVREDASRSEKAS